MKNKAYEQLFFDLDHTLWDFETNSEETLRDLYVELELETKSQAPFEKFHKTYKHYNSLFWDRFRKGHISREDLRWKRMWRTLVDFKITNEELSKQLSERYLDILPTKTNVFPHCMEVLEYLKNKQYPMHLITNGFEKTQHQKIKNCGIASYFTEVITSEQAGIMKPHAAIYEYAMHKTSSTADKCIMVGDTLEVDILGALNVGMDAVYVHASLPEGSSVQPTYVVSDLAALKQIL
jgi:putative hydrolase of the HAD superfamily